MAPATLPGLPQAAGAALLLRSGVEGWAALLIGICCTCGDSAQFCLPTKQVPWTSRQAKLG